jgi:formylmethanofuran dehydrogenase subunit E
VKTLSIDPATADLAAMIERGTAFHGHLGPFLVAGIRMGLYALSLLGSPGYFGVRAKSEAGRTTPLSCLNDGIQIGSGCTTGKGNLEVVEGGLPRVRFETEAKAVVVELREEIARSFRGTDPIERARELVSLPVEELFTWTTPSSG